MKLLLSCGVCVFAGGMVALAYYDQKLNIVPHQITLPADGAEHEAFRLIAPSWLFTNQQIETSEPRLLRMLEDGAQPDHWYGMVKAPVTPGSAQPQLRWRHRTFIVPITFVLDSGDSYSDGTPDFSRLHTPQDREAFRSWFTAIAEAQADLQPNALPVEINDCAALLRYAYREALHAHNENWLQAHATRVPGPSIQQYTYPQTPLAANLFRVRTGPFLPADLGDGGFAEFADARTLMERNSYLVSRDVQQARPGDLIFYRQLEQEAPYDDHGAPQPAGRYHSPYHSMIVCGEKGNWVVYHTGPIHHGKGEMRGMPVSDLLRYPDPRWRPLKQNPNFLGVYRWNILREGD